MCPDLSHFAPTGAMEYNLYDDQDITGPVGTARIGEPPLPTRNLRELRILLLEGPDAYFQSLYPTIIWPIDVNMLPVVPEFTIVNSLSEALSQSG